MSVNYVEKYDMLSIDDLRDAMDHDLKCGYTPERFGPYDLYSLKRRDRERGYYYFSEEAMRFFGSRVNTILRTGVFVEGVNNFEGVRRYRISWITPCGAVVRLSEHDFATMRTADKAAFDFSREIENSGILPERYTTACS